MQDPLKDKVVVLGVAGSIACYKAVDLASKLIQGGALVDVVLTPGAQEFITPLTYRSITHRPVVTGLFDPHSEISMDHVTLSQRADIVVVAPATANIIAKIAWGFSEDALTATILATQAPILVAPAMDAHMFVNTATQENVAKLRTRGYTIAGPGKGHLASGLIGVGRLLEPDELMGHIRLLLGRNGDLAGRTIVVSAGGTQEPIDPVRVITNRSSGKMGYALAEAARDRGANVVLIAAPTTFPDPIGIQVKHVESAWQMHDAVSNSLSGADALIMAAAVADYTPATVEHQKIKKGPENTFSLELNKTPDIISEAQGEGLIKVGFAAESQDLLANAKVKLEGKGLHLIAANDITAEGSGFGADTNKVIILDREGGTEELPLLSKYEVGHRILDRVAGLMGT